jgi:hypothetical protein
MNIAFTAVLLSIVTVGPSTIVNNEKNSYTKMNAIWPIACCQTILFLDFLLTNCRSQNVSTLTAKAVFAQVKINESPIFLKKKKRKKTF